MKYKVALATFTGENIDLHFGRCSKFQVAEITDNEEWNFADEIDTGLACDGGSSVSSVEPSSTTIHSKSLFVCATKEL